MSSKELFECQILLQQQINGFTLSSPHDTTNKPTPSPLPTKVCCISTLLFLSIMSLIITCGKVLDKFLFDPLINGVSGSQCVKSSKTTWKCITLLIKENIGHCIKTFNWLVHSRLGNFLDDCYVSILCKFHSRFLIEILSMVQNCFVERTMCRMRIVKHVSFITCKHVLWLCERENSKIVWSNLKDIVCTYGDNYMDLLKLHYTYVWCIALLKGLLHITLCFIIWLNIKISRNIVAILDPNINKDKLATISTHFSRVQSATIGMVPPMNSS